MWILSEGEIIRRELTADEILAANEQKYNSLLGSTLRQVAVAQCLASIGATDGVQLSVLRQYVSDLYGVDKASAGPDWPIPPTF